MLQQHILIFEATKCLGFEIKAKGLLCINLIPVIQEEFENDAFGQRLIR